MQLASPGRWSKHALRRLAFQVLCILPVSMATQPTNTSGHGPASNPIEDLKPSDSRDWALLSATGTCVLVFGQLLVLLMPPSEARTATLLALFTIFAGDFLIIVGVVRHAVLFYASWGADEATLKVSLGVTAAVVLILFNVMMLLMHQSTSALAARRIQELEGKLPNVLASGKIRLVNVRWLMLQPPGYSLPRRQDLEKIPGALVSPATAVRLLKQGRISCLSYKWLSEKVPDPDGFHLAAVCAFYFRAAFPLTSALRQYFYPALFWDFGSIPQKDESGKRTEAEKADFDDCLNVMNSAFATPRTLVLQHRLMPHHIDEGTLTYEQSGWCCVEQALASLAASARCRVRHHDLGLGWVAWEYVKLKPADMRRMLQKKTFQNGSVDADLVGRLYEELYEKVRCFDAANTPWLCAWSDHIISRCPMPQVVGLWLLGVYALFVLVFPFVMLAFPLHDGYEAYPLTSYSFSLAISLLPFFLFIVPSEILHTHASILLAKWLFRVGLLTAGAAIHNQSGRSKSVSDLFQERLNLKRQEQSERHVLRRMSSNEMSTLNKGGAASGNAESAHAAESSRRFGGISSNKVAPIHELEEGDTVQVEEMEPGAS